MARKVGYKKPGSSGDVADRFRNVYQPGATDMSKTERDYLKHAKNKDSAREAIQRARRANKKPPARTG